MNKYYKQVVTAALLMTSCIPAAVMAESASDSGAGTLSAAARLNLRVTIPRFLFFRVGTVGGTIDQIAFAPAAGSVGDGSSVSGIGGDAPGGSGANVSVRSNGGQITITETNDGGVGGLGSGGGISLSEISVTSSDGTLATPTLSDTGGGTSSPTLNAGNVTNRTAIWTYAYDNTTTPADGNYDAQIIYTAASP